ncbi:MAG: hypothetical protein RSE00_05165 [Clostridia bacterium]
MNKLWILFKNIMFNTYKFNKKSNRGAGLKGIGSIFSIVFIVLIMVLYASLYSYIGMKFLQPYNLEKYIPILFFLLGQIAVFMLSINSAKAGLFDSKDNDLVFSMPIKPGIILSSRLLSLIIPCYIVSIAVFIPSVIVYSILVNVSPIFYIVNILISLLLPIIPIILASIIGYIVAFFASKSQKSKIVETIVTFVIFFGVMISITSIQTLAMKFVQNVAAVELIINKYLPLIGLMQKALFEYSILSLVVFALVNLGLFVLYVLILSKGYIKLTMKLNEIKVKRTNKKETFEKSNKMSALVKREFKRYYSTPIYIFNTFTGVLMFVMLTIFVLISGPDTLSKMFSIELSQKILPAIIAAVASFMIAMSNTTCSSISLEGKSFWILKSLPITTKEVLKSKIILNVLVVLPLIAICIIALAIYFKIGIIATILLLIIATLECFVISLFGLLTNLKYPNLNFVTEAQVVKQSMSSFVSIMVPTVIVFILIGVGGTLVTVMSFNLLAMLLILALVVVMLVEKIILDKWGVKRYNKF